LQSRRLLSELFDIWVQNGVKLKNIILLVATMFSSGCITVGSEDFASTRRIHIGVVLVENIPATNGLNYKEYTTGGIWFENEEAGIGFKNETLISADQKCQVVFIVKTQGQLDHALKLLKSTLDQNEGEICIKQS